MCVDDMLEYLNDKDEEEWEDLDEEDNDDEEWDDDDEDTLDFFS